MVSQKWDWNREVSVGEAALVADVVSLGAHTLLLLRLARLQAQHN